MTKKYLVGLLCVMMAACGGGGDDEVTTSTDLPATMQIETKPLPVKQQLCCAM